MGLWKVLLVLVLCNWHSPIGLRAYCAWHMCVWIICGYKWPEQCPLHNHHDHALDPPSSPLPPHAHFIITRALYVQEPPKPRVQILHMYSLSNNSLYTNLEHVHWRVWPSYIPWWFAEWYYQCDVKMSWMQERTFFYIFVSFQSSLQVQNQRV